TAALCTSRSAARGASGSLTPAAGLDSRSRAAAAAIRRRARKVTSAPNVSRTVAAPGRSLFGSPESNSARSWAGYTGKDLSDQREKTPIRSVECVALYIPVGQVFDKAALTISLLGLSMAVFGSAEWALRLWHILLALATVFIAYRLARLTLSVRQSLAAALVLLTSGQFFYQSLVPQQDIPLTLFLAMAMSWYLRWEEAAGTRAAVLTGISCALAVLSQGLIGIVLP